MTSWYVLRATPRGEIRAGDELAEVGIDCFVPTFVRYSRLRHTIRARENKQPLLPGYLFARLDLSVFSPHMRQLDDCRHVSAILRAPGALGPSPVPQEPIEDLKRLCASGKFDQGYRRGQDARFRHGQHVRITDGPFEGITAQFQQTIRGPRPRAGFVRVVLDRMFGQAMPVDVKIDELEAA